MPVRSDDSPVVVTRDDGVRPYRMFVDGRWRDAVDGATIHSIDPTTGQAWATVPAGGAEDVDLAVRAARRALEGEWSRWSGRDRARAMRALAELVATDADTLAVLETRDNGKVRRETSSQVGGLPDVLDYYAGFADKLRGATIPTSSPSAFVYTRCEPVGVVAAIVPWNSPLSLAVMKLAPALAAGCTVVLKPSEHTSVTALELADRVARAGIPAGVVNVVTGTGKAAGRALVRHPGIDKISFTGSSSTGSAILRDSASNVPRTMLELGGKSANVVFDDADLDAAVDGAIAGIFAAAGQTCIAGSRLLVQAAVHDEVVAELGRRAEAVRLGDPLDLSTEMGPVAFAAHLDAVLAHCDRAVSHGARRIAGGVRAVGPGLDAGLFIEPTVFAGVNSAMAIARDEVFGPVLAVLRFDDEAEAVAMANDSDFGLAAGIWTADFGRAHRVAAAMEAGTVWVNTYRTSSHAVPFGGFGRSGLGYQGGEEGLAEFTRTKAVWVDTEGAPRDPFRMA